MGGLRAAYTELRFFGKIDEPSRYRPRRSRSTGTPEAAPHLIDSAWRLLRFHMIEEVMLKKKKKTGRLWFIAWSLVYFIVQIWLEREKKERLSSLSISCIKDGSANTNLQDTYPPVIMHRLNCRATVSVCAELGILCVCVHVISDFALLPEHVPRCVSAPVYPSNASREN